jgi:hypothetical protein
METRRWTNPGQPQTLQIAVILLYISAVFSLLGGVGGLGILFAIAFGAGGFGIANEQKWGYWTAVAAAGARLALIGLFVASQGPGALFGVGVLLTLAFPVALFALLVHPMSRSYQRIWFS